MNCSKNTLETEQKKINFILQNYLPLQTEKITLFSVADIDNFENISFILRCVLELTSDENNKANLFMEYYGLKQIATETLYMSKNMQNKYLLSNIDLAIDSNCDFLNTNNTYKHIKDSLQERFENYKLIVIAPLKHYQDFINKNFGNTYDFFKCLDEIAQINKQTILILHNESLNYGIENNYSLNIIKDKAIIKFDERIINTNNIFFNNQNNKEFILKQEN